MKAEIKDNNLIITIPCNTTNPPTSKTGKSKMVASTNGFIATSALVDGKPVKVSLNAIISKD